MCQIIYYICAKCYSGYPRWVVRCESFHPPMEYCPDSTGFKFTIVDELQCSLWPNHRHMPPTLEGEVPNVSGPAPIGPLAQGNPARNVAEEPIVSDPAPTGALAQGHSAPNVANTEATNGMAPVYAIPDAPADWAAQVAAHTGNAAQPAEGPLAQEYPPLPTPGPSNVPAAKEKLGKAGHKGNNGEPSAGHRKQGGSGGKEGGRNGKQGGADSHDAKATKGQKPSKATKAGSPQEGNGGRPKGALNKNGGRDTYSSFAGGEARGAQRGGDTRVMEDWRRGNSDSPKPRSNGSGNGAKNGGKGQKKGKGGDQSGRKKKGRSAHANGGHGGHPHGQYPGQPAPWVPEEPEPNTGLMTHTGLWVPYTAMSEAPQPARFNPEAPVFQMGYGHPVVHQGQYGQEQPQGFYPVDPTYDQGVIQGNAGDYYEDPYGEAGLPYAFNYDQYDHGLPGPEGVYQSHPETGLPIQEAQHGGMDARETQSEADVPRSPTSQPAGSGLPRSQSESQIPVIIVTPPWEESGSQEQGSCQPGQLADDGSVEDATQASPIAGGVEQEEAPAEPAQPAQAVPLTWDEEVEAELEEDATPDEVAPIVPPNSPAMASVETRLSSLPHARPSWSQVAAGRVSGEGMGREQRQAAKTDGAGSQGTKTGPATKPVAKPTTAAQPAAAQATSSTPSTAAQSGATGAPLWSQIAVRPGPAAAISTPSPRAVALSTRLPAPAPAPAPRSQYRPPAPCRPPAGPTPAFTPPPPRPAPAGRASAANQGAGRQGRGERGEFVWPDRGTRGGRGASAGAGNPASRGGRGGRGGAASTSNAGGRGGGRGNGSSRGGSRGDSRGGNSNGGSAHQPRRKD